MSSVRQYIPSEYTFAKVIILVKLTFLMIIIFNKKESIILKKLKKDSNKYKVL